MAALSKKLRSLDGGRVAFWCPGCNEAHQITVVEAPNRQGPIWGYNGDPDAPTFTPSIHVTGSQKLTDEEWEFIDAGGCALAATYLRFVQHFGHAAAPVVAGGLELGQRRRVKAQGYRLLGVGKLRAPPAALDAFGQFREDLGKRLATGGKLLVGEFRAINRVPIFFGVTSARLKFLLGVRHKSFLSLGLARRIEITEIASVPRGANITAITGTPLSCPRAR